MSAYEQKIEPPDRRWQYVLFAAEPYETIGFKVPSREVDKSEDKFWTFWNKDSKQFFLQVAFKIEQTNPMLVSVLGAAKSNKDNLNPSKLTGPKELINNNSNSSKNNNNNTKVLHSEDTNNTNSETNRMSPSLPSTVDPTIISTSQTPNGNDSDENIIENNGNVIDDNSQEDENNMSTD